MLFRSAAREADLRTEVASLRAELAAARAAAPVATSPWARLDRLARVLRPEVASAAWALSPNASGPRRWTCGGYGPGEEVLWEASGATPDEAIAALVAVVEGEATARVEAIRAAMEGRP